MTGQVVNLDAVRELRRLVDGLDTSPDVEQVRSVGMAAWRAGDRQWMAWAGSAFDVVHDRCCECRRGSA